MSARSLSGLDLAEDYYHQVVQPITEEVVQGRPYAAALIGPGSEVQGFDTARSTDHAWGPRVMILLLSQDVPRVGQSLDQALSDALPDSFRGYPTRFSHPRAPDPAGHCVEVTDLARLSATILGFDPRSQVTQFDWLSTSWQRLREFTAGRVFHDAAGELTAARGRLAWYPPDPWAYVLACQWRRIAQEEPFVGRCLEGGDRVGARLVADRLSRDLIHLGMLMDRQYPPYSKWLGTAWHRVSAPDLRRRVDAAVEDADPFEAEGNLRDAYVAALRMHNTLGITALLDPTIRQFHDRPYFISDGDRVAAALRETITDAALRTRPLVGCIDQFVDSTDVLSHPGRCRDLLARDLPID
ncbi:MAG: DUF4037 domain-containing protein [Nocardioidaceae bacterium]